LEDKNKGKEENEKLLKVNKYLVDKDVDIIKGYVKRRNCEMNVTQTGLWYMIYEKGSGEHSKIGKSATLSYKLSLLDGTLCYSSEEDGLKTFRIGKGGVEAGLEEGILLMREGDKARFIMMPHLAHGLIGDEKCIPARAIILYEVELLKISE
jgi:FKBP-type peptidyl-prolyl cis-trans isomerase